MKMFSNHVTKNLSAYCHGELTPAEARQFAEHLIACGRCRAEFEEVKIGVNLAEQLPQVTAPASIWPELERNWEAQASANNVKVLKPSFRLWRPRFVAIAAIVLLAIGLGGAYLFSPKLSRTSWEVVSLFGSPRIDSSTISGKGRLAVGQWLETDSSSRAQIAVGSIGQVEIDPNTRVRLLQTRPTEHRLELAQGKMSARIWAPPRLFFVDTPSAVAADLGCAYTLEVNDKGESLLRVTAGWVALQLKDRESMVPAGAACQTRPGVGPGTPYFEDASETFRTALAKFDFEQAAHDRELPTILNDARPRDAFTVWHLLFRVDGLQREQVYEKLAVLSPPPAGVTREGALRLDQEMLDIWKGNLENSWGNSDKFAPKMLKKLWTGGLGKLNGMAGKK